MDFSFNSSKHIQPVCEQQQEQEQEQEHEHEVEEESGWTAYFEDFSNQQHQVHEQEHSSCSSLGTSMVSDAASCAAWKLSNQVAHPKILKKIRFKKSRTKEISQDDSLEDTASSPVNSPKVSDARPIFMNPRTAEDHHMNSSLGKGYMTSTETYAVDHEQQMDFNTKTDCTDDHLKKRGLCLVPMSMLVNYFG